MGFMFISSHNVVTCARSRASALTEPRSLACLRARLLAHSGASGRGSGAVLRASMSGSGGGGGDGEKPLTCLLEVSKEACDSIGVLE